MKYSLNTTIIEPEIKNEINNAIILLHGYGGDGKDISALPFKLSVDLVAMSGGWTPIVNLFSQSGGKLEWNEKFGYFKPKRHHQNELSIGGSNGIFDVQECINETIKQTNEILVRIGKKKNSKFSLSANFIKLNYIPRNIWLVPNGRISGKGGKAFVDFQNDVTLNDVLLASREGYQSVEHLNVALQCGGSDAWSGSC